MNMDPMRQRLSSEDPEVRRALAASLRGSPEPEAAEVLCALLGDPEWRVRKTAAEALLAAGALPHAGRLLAMLGDGENAGLRNAATEVLMACGETVVPTVLRHLAETSDEDVQIALLNLLQSMGARVPMEAVARWLTSENKNVAAVAVSCLGRCVGAEAYDLLVKVLQSEDVWLAFHAADALGEIGDPRAFDALAPRYKEGVLRKSILQALGRIADVRAVPFLVQALNDPRRLSMDALQALYRVWQRLRRHADPMAARKFESLFRENFPHERVDDLIHQGLMNESALLRAATIEALGWLRSDTATEKLVGYLLDDELRPHAQNALERIGAGARAALASALDDLEANEAALFAALDALGRIGGAESAGAVARRLSHASPEIRCAAAEALGRMQTPMGLDPLFKAMGDRHPSVQEAVARSLTALFAAFPSGEGQAELKRRLHGADPMVRRGALTVLARLRHPDSREALLAAARDEAPEVRHAAFMLMGEQPHESCFEALSAGMSDENSRVRQAAVRSMARLRSPAARRQLLLLLGDEDMWVRAEAAEAVGEAGDGDSATVERLMEISCHDKPPVKIAALRALGALASERAVEHLLREAEAPDEAVRHAAIGALGKFSGAGTRDFLVRRLSSPSWADVAAAVDALSRRADGAEAAGALAALLLTPVDALVLRRVFSALAALHAAEALPVAVAFLEREDCRQELARYVRAVHACAPQALERMAKQLPGPQRQLIEFFVHQPQGR